MNFVDVRGRATPPKQTNIFLTLVQLFPFGAEGVPPGILLKHILGMAVDADFILVRTHQYSIPGANLCLTDCLILF